MTTRERHILRILGGTYLLTQCSCGRWRVALHPDYVEAFLEEEGTSPGKTEALTTQHTITPGQGTRSGASAAGRLLDTIASAHTIMPGQRLLEGRW